MMAKNVENHVKVRRCRESLGVSSVVASESEHRRGGGRSVATLLEFQPRNEGEGSP